MDRRTLKLPFSIERTPDWTCPSCEKGILRIVKDSFKKEERRHSRNHSHDAWEPEQIEYVYSCLLVCNNDACNEVVSNVGTGGVQYDEFEDENGDWNQSNEERFQPSYFEPHLKLLIIPPACPQSIVAPLYDAFKLFFAAPSAASNSVRSAIEELLTELKVKRFVVTNGHRRVVSLHQRIAILPKRFGQLKEMLTAIKWLGNAGSHGGSSISHDDVLDSFDLTEHVLTEIFAPKKKRLAAIAKKVNKKKGPSN